MTVNETFRSATLKLHVGPLEQNEASRWIDVSAYPDLSVQITGTYGGATVSVESSNDKATGVTARNFEGTAMSFTSGTQLESPRDHAEWLRVVVSGGDMTTAIEAFILGGTR